MLFRLIVAFLTLFTLSCWAKSPDPFTNPFDNPVDDSDLPRVLIIGDSISIGYTPLVRKLLQNKANVHRPSTNCRWSAFGAENIDEWIGESSWDLIHFNFGLWDWYGWKHGRHNWRWLHRTGVHREINPKVHPPWQQCDSSLI